MAATPKGAVLSFCLRGRTVIPFDPWTATLEAAVEAQGQYNGVASYLGPIFLWEAVQRLKVIEAVHERSGFDVLEAVQLCAWHELIMPPWLASEVLNRYRAVQQLRTASWDDPAAFGRPYPKGAQVETMRRRRENRIKVGLAVTKFVKEHPTKPLDPEWTRIGGLIAKSDKEAQKIFAEALQLGVFSSPGVIREQMGFPAVPPKYRKVRGRQR